MAKDSKTAMWDRLYKTPTEQTKPFKRQGGFSGTSIKPMYAVHRATEEFGPCGQGWGWTVHDTRFQDGMVFCLVSVWYVNTDGRHETGAQWGGTQILDHKGNYSDECCKMSVTDALTKCLSYLGVGADVHMGQHDGDKYQRPAAEAANGHTQAPVPDVAKAARAAIEKAPSLEKLNVYVENLKKRHAEGAISEDQFIELNNLAGAKIQEFFQRP